ncbi:Nitrate/nitrite response regulator protein narL [Chlamydia abortus]|uniref:Response regulator n=1 Tax=Paenibacillus residui TaxID=629724 RepID=A0ABW3DD80_9BACL|nr:MULTISPECIES: response regulator transcription factor [Paenibacillaceae]SHE09747.1 Nitrate/nitrite response regulator protein narL [Chlamydia abortus]
MNKYRVLIADDHPLARQAVRTLLEDDPAFDIVGEATNGIEAVEACERLRPNVVLMDIHMPEMNGLEATRRIKAQDPAIKIVILSVSDAAADLFTAIQFGAQGYLLKNMDPGDWADYLHALLEEDTETARRMADRLYYQFKAVKPSQGPPPSLLTPREKEILAYIAEGDTNKQIADKLVIAENTVKNHVKNVLEKLSLDNRVQLAAYAVSHRISRSGDE